VSRSAATAAWPRLRKVVFAGALQLTALSGCAGGSPLLHPARTLHAGEVRASAGFSSSIALGSHSEALRGASAIAASGPATSSDAATRERYARGALVSASIAPGLAPFVAARVGIGSAFEGGLAYTGRGARLDVRRAIEIEGTDLTLSVGVGGSAVFSGQVRNTALPALPLSSLRGFGADIPLVLGWESDAGIYKGWLGARGAFERVEVELLRSASSAASLVPVATRLEGNRFLAGGIVGFAIGFRHVHVAMEMSLDYQSVTGTHNGTAATVSSLTTTPATALWFGF
jgi:hypothetical protein